MKNTTMPGVIANCRKTIRKYFANCLAGSAEGVSITNTTNEIVRATVDLFILHYKYGDGEVVEEVLEALEAAGVGTESTPGSIAATTCLHRFSGLDLNE